MGRSHFARVSFASQISPSLSTRQTPKSQRFATAWIKATSRKSASRQARASHPQHPYSGDSSSGNPPSACYRDANPEKQAQRRQLAHFVGIITAEDYQGVQKNREANRQTSSRYYNRKLDRKLCIISNLAILQVGLLIGRKPDTRFIRFTSASIRKKRGRKGRDFVTDQSRLRCAVWAVRNTNWVSASLRGKVRRLGRQIGIVGKLPVLLA